MWAHLFDWPAESLILEMLIGFMIRMWKLNELMDACSVLAHTLCSFYCQVLSKHLGIIANHIISRKLGVQCDTYSTDHN